MISWLVDRILKKFETVLCHRRIFVSSTAIHLRYLIRDLCKTHSTAYIIFPADIHLNCLFWVVPSGMKKFDSLLDCEDTRFALLHRLYMEHISVSRSSANHAGVVVRYAPTNNQSNAPIEVR